MLLIKRIDGDRWECMVRPGKRLHDGDTVLFEGRTGTVLRAKILGYQDPENGTRLVEFSYDGIFMEVLEDIGSMPLPPYITRQAEESDKEMYQTVYSRIDGSVAAPTAGLHFTKDLLAKAAEKGVHIAYVTLHVGIGTFRPVKVENIEDHRMHFEECSIDEENAAIINDTIEQGGRIISVGTTSTRTLESMAGMPFQPFSGKGSANKLFRVRAGETSTGIFIYPGYEFKIVDSLITNFHLPKSTLLMLISALYDREKILEAYEEAVKEKYRFFSYGDAMLII
jgi:S-adenosylmethionine:tRNA ribosyltransferase-isomerase